MWMPKEVLMNRRRYVMAMILCVVVSGIAAPAFAAKGGNGSHGNSVLAASCVAVDGVVTGSGLPTNEVVNFMVTDSSGTTGWVLGYTWDGTFSVRVPATSAPTTYEFSAEPGP
jgi:hypothetical protein